MCEGLLTIFKQDLSIKQYTCIRVGSIIVSSSQVKCEAFLRSNPEISLLILPHLKKRKVVCRVPRKEYISAIWESFIVYLYALRTALEEEQYSPNRVALCKISIRKI